MNTWIELAASLENHIDKAIDQAYPHNWDENYLSRRLLDVIHGFLHSRPYLRGHEHVRVSMECYKLNAPRASLLLYDYEATPEFIGPLGVDFWSYRDQPLLTSTLPARPVTRVRAVPLSTAVALKVKDTRLHSWGLPLSIQLVARYFCGLDLEHSAACVDSLMGRGGKLLPRRLAVITVVEEFARSADMPDITINPEVFEREPG